MPTSLFELFKIGIGPSSSHTVGPMVAARRFVSGLETAELLDCTDRLRVDLYGSLALTGKGHGTDRAVILGLCGEKPQTVDPASIDLALGEVRQTSVLRLLQKRPIGFDEQRDILFHRDQTLPFHPNGMTFTALNDRKEASRSESYYSPGGGFVVSETETGAKTPSVLYPYPFHSAVELLVLCRQERLAIWELMLRNECALRSEAEVGSEIDRIWQTMRDSMERGMATTGILPGGLKVRRRAARMAERLRMKAGSDALAALDWVSVFAMAVNEENAAGGRVVTAPTNGAAGILPAVATYYRTLTPEGTDAGVQRLLLTAAAIGSLYKENASISGAEVGCQGEVGVASSMAAGGLVAALGGSNEEVEHAAEIAMEHNLGMTCDPIGGLVQIPCIERNAMGAVKAINACRMAMNESDGHKVSLDQVIETMYRTGLDMQSRYKETSLAGLALNVIEC